MAPESKERLKMPNLVIRVECKDSSDLEWLRTRCIAAVQEEVEDNRERLDASAEVSWDTEDD